MSDLTGQRVLIVGGARGIGLALSHALTAAGASVIIGARDIDNARTATAGNPGAQAVGIDITDEGSVALALAWIGAIDHIVITASSHHNVPVRELEHHAIVAAFEAKVIGPMLLAKHAAAILPETGSILLFSGVAAWNPAPGYSVMGITNGAVAFAAKHLARELAPIRVNAISPGITDSGTWDSMGEDSKQAFLSDAAENNLAGRPGHNTDIAEAALWLLGAGFVSGETIHVEGGARHA